MKKMFTYLFCLLTLLSGAGGCSQKVAPGSQAGNKLRVMTYNIHHGNPPTKEASGEIDLEAIVAAIRKEAPDLVALQEVDVHTPLPAPSTRPRK
jgi:hypothetical protein